MNDTDELPPLPEPFMAVFTVNGRLTPELQQRYEQQMHDYGRACIAAASARRAAQAAQSAGEVEREARAVCEHPPCKGMNCGITRTDQEHSLECQAEHAAAIAGGRFVKEPKP